MQSILAFLDITKLFIPGEKMLVSAGLKGWLT